MVKKRLTLSIVMILLMFSGCQNTKNVVPDNSNVSKGESSINSLSNEKIMDLSKSVTKIEKLKDVPKEIYKGNIVLNKMQQDCTIA